MKSKVCLWGNSLAIRVPKAMGDELGLLKDSMVELEVSEGQLVVTPIAKVFSLEEMVARITPENRHTEVDWGAPQGNELN